MIKIIDLKETNGKSEESIDKLLAKRNGNKIDVTNTVKEILEEVRKNGDKAIKKYTLKFDNVKIDNLKVTKKEIAEAYKIVDKKLISVMKKSAKNVYDFHKKQAVESIIYNKTSGIKLGILRRGLEKVGIYVPARNSTTYIISNYECNSS